jgi:hypothetical protein
VRIAVTICTPDFHDLAVAAVDAWRKFAHMDTIILVAESGRGFEAKLSMVDQLPAGQIIYYDADTRAVRPLDVDYLFETPGVCAVHDNGVRIPEEFPARDCVTHSLDPARYFNSGFWAADTRDPLVLAWLRRAREFRSTYNYADTTDQSPVNHAAQSLRVPTRLIDAGWNHCPINYKALGTPIPEKVFVAHAAGFPMQGNETLPAKADVLRAAELLYRNV